MSPTLDTVKVKANAWLLLTSALFYGGCENRVHLEWSVAFASADLKARAARVEVYIVEPDCEGEAELLFVHEGDMTEGAPVKRRPGSYGLRGVAIDASCRVFAEGCVPLRLPPNARRMVVTLDATTEEARCSATECTGGTCGAADAGADAGGETWEFEPVAVAGAGYGPRLAVDSEGVVHLAYQNSSRSGTWYLRRGSGGWSEPENLAEMTGVRGGVFGLSVVAGRVHMLLRNEDSGELDHTVRDAGGGWSSSLVATITATGPSFVVTPDGLVIVAYVDSEGLQVARRSESDSEWAAETVALEALSTRVASALGTDGQPQLLFEREGRLTHATTDGSAWALDDFMVLENASVRFALANSANGRVHVVYAVADDAIRYAWKDDEWQDEVMVTGMNFGEPAVTLDGQQALRVGLYTVDGEPNQTLFLASRDGTWMFELLGAPLDGRGYGGFDLATGPDGRVHVVYSGLDASLYWGVEPR